MNRVPFHSDFATFGGSYFYGGTSKTERRQNTFSLKFIALNPVLTPFFFCICYNNSYIDFTSNDRYSVSCFFSSLPIKLRAQRIYTYLFLLVRHFYSRSLARSLFIAVISQLLPFCVRLLCHAIIAGMYMYCTLDF